MASVEGKVWQEQWLLSAGSLAWVKQSFSGRSKRYVPCACIPPTWRNADETRTHRRRCMLVPAVPGGQCSSSSIAASMLCS
jgi:acyl carrier protein phosphodiesterase